MYLRNVKYFDATK